MIDPILLELYRHRFAGIADEMGVTLRRTAYSPNIKERLDFSCALFDAGGRMVAQAAHIPVHLGAMPRSVQAALNTIETWEDGDLVLLNDPYDGGTHLPDITMISPVFVGGELAFLTASRAHHADVGGMAPGSLPLSNEIYQEGLIIPPIKLYRTGQLNRQVMAIILRNVRTPEERRGDLAAQRSAHAVGDSRLQELAARHGLDEMAAYAGHLIAYSERLMRENIWRWPRGTYAFEDRLEMDESSRPARGKEASGRLEQHEENPGRHALDEEHPSTPALDQEAVIRVIARIADGEVTFDFDGTSSAVDGSLNAVMSITESACYYAARCLADEPMPMNQGCFAPVRVQAPVGCLVNARPPHAVAAGNVETSQRIVDAVFGALAQAMPDRVPAASQGTMNNLTIGGARLDGTPYAYYETIAGGMGGSADGDGLSGVHIHMTNTLNTPIEALEMTFPFRVDAYALRRGSGGGGRHSGGNGVVRTYRFLAPASVTVMSDRRQRGPYGLAGGDSGAPGRNVLVRADGTEEVLPSKFTRRFREGDVLRIETPGGGGWGPSRS